MFPPGGGAEPSRLQTIVTLAAFAGPGSGLALIFGGNFLRAVHHQDFERTFARF